MLLPLKCGIIVTVTDVPFRTTQVVCSLLLFDSNLILLVEGRDWKLFDWNFRLTLCLVKINLMRILKLLLGIEILLQLPCSNLTLYNPFVCRMGAIWRMQIDLVFELEVLGFGSHRFFQLQRTRNGRSNVNGVVLELTLLNDI